jgi:hypothetical protein
MTDYQVAAFVLLFIATFILDFLIADEIRKLRKALNVHNQNSEEV